MILFIVSIVFFAFLIRATLGFGDALLAMPILILIVGIKIAAPLMALLALVIAFIVFYKNNQTVNYKISIRLIISSIAGIPVGLYYLQHLNEQVINLVLGIIILVFSGYKLSGLSFQIKTPGYITYIVGFFSGIIGAAYNTNGPPVIMLLSAKKWPPETFRSTLQCYFFFSGAAVVAGHFISGNVDKQVLIYFIFTLPALALAFFIGEILYKKIHSDLFYKVVYAVLLLLSLSLILKAIV